jgi:hypothetical protein
MYGEVNKIANVERQTSQTDRLLESILDTINTLERQSSEFQSALCRVRDTPISGRDVPPGISKDSSLPFGLLNKLEFLHMKMCQISGVNSDTIQGFRELL